MSKNYFNNDNPLSLSDRFLYTPSEFARKNLNYIQEIGKLKSIKPHISTRKELDSFLFFIIQKGSGTVTVNGVDYHVNEGDVVFLNCQDNYQHISDENSQWELTWIHFNGINAQPFFELYKEKNSNKPFSSVQDTSYYTNIMNQMIENRDCKDIVMEMNISLKIVELLTKLIEDIIEISQHKEEFNFIRIREYVNEHFTESNLFEKICKQYSYDEIVINQQYKNKFGIDLCDYILNRRFTYAKELLRFTVKPISDVIRESGIDNADLFRHLFIENEGITDEEYRKKWSQWNMG